MKSVVKSNILLVLSALLLCSCNHEKLTELKNFTIHQDPEFGHICVDISIENFMKKGFKFGDSCDINFSNGFTLNDIPFYDGYYVKTGDFLVVGYPGYEYIEICKNNTSGYYESLNFDEKTTVTITVNQKEKYKVYQDALSLKYSDDRASYDSDVVFANFRNVKYGDIGSNVLYRGASPVNNSHNRAKYVDNLLKENGINFIIDLSDNATNMDSYMAKDDFNSEYTLSLYEAGKVTYLGLNMGYTGESYGITCANGIREILNHEGPYYFHCTEGKDRTGFFAIILEALMGATTEELEEDYMITYSNYYGLTKEKDPEKYQAIVDLRFQEFIDFFNDEAAVGTLTLKSKVYNYLKRSGLTDNELEQIIQVLSTDIPR